MPRASHAGVHAGVGPTRRQWLRSALASVGTSLLAAPLAGCGGLPAPGGALGSAAGGGRGSAALLLPLTGEGQAVGQAMARAVAIVTGERGGADRLPAFDTKDTVEGSVAAARAALAGGARMLFGPLRSDQTAAVVPVAGEVPVVSFSNDEALAGLGAFVMGITPAQSVAAILSYVQAQGLRRVAMLSRDTPFGQASATAMRSLAPAAGLTLTAVVLRDPGQAGAAAALRDGAGAPDAVYLPEGGATLAAFARGLRGSGVQLLGSVQWGLGEITANPDLAGAWFAAAPPDLFLPFADRYAALHGEAPGIIAALGHDAALVALGLAGAGALNRRGLLRQAGFTGALGPFRFQRDGRAVRDLSVLTVGGGSYALLAEVTGS